MNRTHVVYRCFAADGELLYIGQTSQLETRCAGHRCGSPWWADVVAVVTSRLTTQRAALRLERLAIRHERPRHNVHHGPAATQRMQHVKQELAGVLLDRPLAEYVAEKRTARPRWPWRLIAEQLAADTGGKVAVSHEALRSWYGAELHEQRVAS